MLYSILLMFILSCSKLIGFIHHNDNNYNLRIRDQKEQKDIKHTTKQGYVTSEDYWDDYVEEGQPTYSLHNATSKNEILRVQIMLNQDYLEVQCKNIDQSDMRVNTKDDQGYLPIHWAVSKKFSNKRGRYAQTNLKILELLLPYPSSYQGDKEGMTILHYAVKNQLPESVKQILKHFRKQLPSFINQKDKNGFTALHYAVDKDTDKNKNYTEAHLKILHTLLQDAGIDIMETDNDGQSALHWAVANNNLEAVKALYEYAKSKFPLSYKDFINMKTFINPKTNIGGCPAIYWTTSPECPPEDAQASRAISLEIFKLLLPEWEMNNTDNQGQTLAHWIARRSRNDMLKELIKRNKNFDPNMQDNQGYTILRTTIAAIHDIETNIPGKLESQKNYKNALLQQCYCIITQISNLQSPRIDKDTKNRHEAEPIAIDNLNQLVVQKSQLENQIPQPGNKRPSKAAKKRNEDLPLPPKKRYTGKKFT
ncbi:ankyrin repeat domain-containing protein [Cardinium endosymbiont of Nabis limbatus]|uniref:ankyrin repeat domain-containing protein n=1 Tax=Cardinium endosymbiont of Nabis limbatus TaxID=3066217 RepID=UPI003AF35D21